MFKYGRVELVREEVADDDLAEQVALDNTVAIRRAAAREATRNTQLVASSYRAISKQI